jgi:hypothetical protein
MDQVQSKLAAEQRERKLVNGQLEPAEFAMAGETP